MRERVENSLLSDPDWLPEVVRIYDIPNVRQDSCIFCQVKKMIFPKSTEVLLVERLNAFILFDSMIFSS